MCEDGIFIGSRIVAVIDGATSHGKLLWNGGRSGRFAKDVLCDYLRLHEGELAELPAAECMSRLNNALSVSVKRIHPEIYTDPNALAEYPRVSVILFNDVAGEVWSYGDCLCMIGDELHSEVKEVDRLLSVTRSFVILSSLREQVACKEASENGPLNHLSPRYKNIGRDFLKLISGHDIGREVIEPLLKKQLWSENVTGRFGYPVLNGLNFAEGMVKVWPVPSGAEVVLASDGYPELVGRLRRVRKCFGRLMRRIRFASAGMQ